MHFFSGKGSSTLPCICPVGSPFLPRVRSEVKHLARFGNHQSGYEPPGLSISDLYGVNISIHTCKVHHKRCKQWLIGGTSYIVVYYSCKTLFSKGSTTHRSALTINLIHQKAVAWTLWYQYQPDFLSKTKVCLKLAYGQKGHKWNDKVHTVQISPDCSTSYTTW